MTLKKIVAITDLSGDIEGLDYRREIVATSSGEGRKKQVSEDSPSEDTGIFQRLMRAHYVSGSSGLFGDASDVDVDVFESLEPQLENDDIFSRNHFNVLKTSSFASSESFIESSLKAIKDRSLISLFGAPSHSESTNDLAHSKPGIVFSKLSEKSEKVTPETDGVFRQSVRSFLTGALNAGQDMALTFPLMVLSRQFQSGKAFHPRIADYYESCLEFTVPYMAVVGGGETAGAIAKEKGYPEILTTVIAAATIGGALAAPLEAPVIWGHNNPSGTILSYADSVKQLGLRGLYKGFPLIGVRDTFSGLVFLKGPDVIEYMGGDRNSVPNLFGLGVAGGVVSAVADDLRTNYVVTGESPFKSWPTFKGAFKSVDIRGAAVRGGVFGVSSILFAGLTVKSLGINGVGYDTVSKPIVDGAFKLGDKVKDFLSK